MNDLKAQINSLLSKQGTNTTYDDISSNFRHEQLETMLKHNIHIIDMDRWAHLERLLKTHLDWWKVDLLLHSCNKRDIEILELNSEEELTNG